MPGRFDLHINLGWLRDFIAVAEHGGISRAAEIRAITQPAMSRHIRSLEERVGVNLVDRTIYPARLTQAGQEFLVLARQQVEMLDCGIRDLRAAHLVHGDAVRFAMQHALSAAYFSGWWQGLRARQADGSGTTPVPDRIHATAMDFHDCVQQLKTGQCDFMMTFLHPGSALLDGDPDFEMQIIGRDRVAPLSALDSSGQPVYSIDDSRIPLARSAENDFMGQVSSSIIARNHSQERFTTVYQDAFSEGVKGQVLSGAGVGFLPGLLVQAELESGVLVIIGDQEWQLVLDIALVSRSQDPRPMIEAIREYARG